MRRVIPFLLLLLLPTFALAADEATWFDSHFPQAALYPVVRFQSEDEATLVDYASEALLDDDGEGGHSHNIKDGRPDSHAPAGLMGDHVHHQGDWMVEYKFMHMYMDGMRTGTTSLSDVASLSGATNGTGVSFAITPTRMTMDMHMFHIMRGWTDNITAYLMPMVLDNSMDHLSGMGTRFNTHITGFGDLPFGALWRVYDGDTDEVIVNVGFSAPTGQIRSVVGSGPPPPPGTLFPYPMRLGSGTFDARPGVTYKSYGCNHSMGLQYQTDLPLGKNYRGYREGAEHRLNWWVTRLLGPRKKMALSFRTEALWRDAFVGFDTDFGRAPTLINTIRPDMRGGEWINLGYGFMYQMPKGGRWNVEVTHPVYQSLRGVQLETDLMATASYSKAF